MPEKESEHNPLVDLLLVLAFIIALVVYWIYIGAPGHANLNSFFIQSPLGNGAPAASSGGTSRTDAEKRSADTVLIEDAGGGMASDPSQEYLILRADSNNAAPLSISGWTIKSARSGKSAIIGGAVEVPMQGQAQSNGAVTLRPGDTAIISTGRSPVGYSFRENECTGYFGQFQTFSPRLSQSCPYPSQELAQSGGTLNDDPSCAAAAGSIGSCQALTSNPSDVSPACRSFLTQRFTYNGCVAAHRSDARFEGPQWRIYLGLLNELWDNRSDALELLDSSGKLVSSTSY